MLTGAALACGQDTQPLTGPESPPVLDAAATTALAFYQVSAGTAGSCGLTTDQRAYCWGINTGDGTNIERLTPVAIAPTLRFPCSMLWLLQRSMAMPETISGRVARILARCVGSDGLATFGLVAALSALGRVIATARSGQSRPRAVAGGACDALYPSPGDGRYAHHETTLRLMLVNDTVAMIVGRVYRVVVALSYCALLGIAAEHFRLMLGSDTVAVIVRESCPSLSLH